MAHRAFCGLARRRRFSVTAGPLSRHSSALGDPDAAGRALERALDIAEPDTVLSAFVLPPVPALQERHARGGTTPAGPDRRDPGPARRARVCAAAWREPVAAPAAERQRTARAARAALSAHQ